MLPAWPTCILPLAPSASAELLSALAEGANRKLCRLSLRANDLTDEPSVVEALHACVSTSPTLRELDLSDNRLADASAAAIGGALPLAPALHTLIMEWNKVGPDGAAALSAGLNANTSLKELYVRVRGARRGG